MPNRFNFPFICSCGSASNCVLTEPVNFGGLYVAPDCLCGNTIIISPTKKLLDGKYEYNVRICKTERETKEKTPGV